MNVPFDEEVRISGFLWKKKDGFMKRSWVRRWAMIQGSFLIYFSDEYGKSLRSQTANSRGWRKGDEQFALGTIPISMVFVTEYEHKSRPLTFQIGHPERRTVFLAAESEFQLRNWMTHIQRASLGPVNPPQTINLHY